MQFDFHPDRNAVVITGDGPLTLEVLSAALADLAVDARFDFAAHQIFDLRRMSGMPAQVGQMEVLVARLGRSFNKGSGRIALIAEGELAYGLGRMFSAIAADALMRQVGMFRTLDEALEWCEAPGGD